MTQFNRLPIIAAGYRQMPNGGAILQVTDSGMVSNGISIISAFENRRAAEKALRQAGFEKRSLGWKLPSVRPALGPCLTTELEAAWDCA